VIPPLEIFKVDKEGHPIWVQATDSLDKAKARVQELGKSWPAEYWIVSRTTGHKVRIKPSYQEPKATGS
jgi:hypothetical protein